MPISQGRNAAGNTVDVAAGALNQQIVGNLHGKYAEQALKGNLWYTSTVVAGLAIPINTTTAPLVMLWNPTDSGVDAVLGKFTAAQASGTPAGGAIGLMTVSTLVSVGSNIATGNLITAFAQDVTGTNRFNARLNSGSSPKVKSSSQGTNTITAGTWVKSLGLALHAVVATTATTDAPMLTYDFDGDFVLSPGVAIYLASNVASVALYHQTLSWYEVPAA
jgi:hypothetical protein